MVVGDVESGDVNDREIEGDFVRKSGSSNTSRCERGREINDPSANMDVGASIVPFVNSVGDSGDFAVGDIGFAVGEVGGLGMSGLNEASFSGFKGFSVFSGVVATGEVGDVGLVSTGVVGLDGVDVAVCVATVGRDKAAGRIGGGLDGPSGRAVKEVDFCIFTTRGVGNVSMDEVARESCALGSSG